MKRIGRLGSDLDGSCGAPTRRRRAARPAGEAKRRWPQNETVLVATPPRAIADFTLTDQQGRDFKFASLRGQRVLVFFGFAHCPDICPATLLKLRQLKQAAPQELADVRVVMISVDGDRDSPQLLKEYLSAFWPDFIGLTGTPAVVRDIAARFPAVFIKGIPRRRAGITRSSTARWCTRSTGRGSCGPNSPIRKSMRWLA